MVFMFYSIMSGWVNSLSLNASCMCMITHSPVTWAVSGSSKALRSRWADQLSYDLRTDLVIFCVCIWALFVVLVFPCLRGSVWTILHRRVTLQVQLDPDGIFDLLFRGLAVRMVVTSGKIEECSTHAITHRTEYIGQSLTYWVKPSSKLYM